MKSMPAAETLDRILISAETLFAENGYHGTTLRQITQKAAVNLAAVNYHHGDKESLYLEILRRRWKEANDRRLARLIKTERLMDGDPVPLETLFEIMAAPLFELHADDRGRAGAQLLGRCLTEPLPFMEDFLAGEFQPAMARFGQALRRHVPALPAEEFMWRLNFIVGALQHALATLHRMKSLTRGICRDCDYLAAQRHFVNGAAAIFASSPPIGQGRQQSG
jgi:AcrR family transcriptional regulator